MNSKLPLHACRIMPNEFAFRRIQIFFLQGCGAGAWSPASRAGLTIGQSGHVPGTSRLNIKTLLYCIFMFLGCSPDARIVELFYCRVFRTIKILFNLLKNRMCAL